MIAILTSLSSACGSTSTCSRPDEDVTIEFEPSMLSDDGVYSSAPYGGPYHFFPGGRTLHFQHGLGKAPLLPSLSLWLAFEAEGKGDNPLAPGAGNAVEVVGLDDEEIAVRTIRAASITCRWARRLRASRRVKECRSGARCTVVPLYRGPVVPLYRYTVGQARPQMQNTGGWGGAAARSTGCAPVPARPPIPNCSRIWAKLRGNRQ